MRDDIHKRVPKPPAVQKWVRLSVNDADRRTDRPFDALQDAMRDTCRRELSPTFVGALVQALNAPAELFGHLNDAASPRDLGGRGGTAEWEVLSEAKRLIAKGTQPQLTAHAAIASVMKTRVDADIRVTAAVFPRRDIKTPVVLDSMKADARRVDFHAFADSVCNGQVYEPRSRARPAIDLDGDMRGTRSGGGR